MISHTDPEQPAEQIKRGRGRPSRTGLKRNKHCVYDINYHIVFTTKYRRKVITAEILELIIQQASSIATQVGL